MLQSVPLSTEDLEFKSPIEWEERGEGFFLENLWLTLKASLVAPKRFFENLRRNGSYIRPLLYAVLIEFFVAAVISLLWGGILSGFVFGGTGHLGILGANFKIFTLATGLGFLIIGLWASSLIYYIVALCLGMRSGFRSLFRMYVYTESVVLFRLIPIIGIFVAEIYRVILLFFGFKKVYRCSDRKAMVAAIVPAIILVVLMMVLSHYSLYYLLKA